MHISASHIEPNFKTGLGPIHIKIFNGKILLNQMLMGDKAHLNVQL